MILKGFLVESGIVSSPDDVSEDTLYRKSAVEIADLVKGDRTYTGGDYV